MKENERRIHNLIILDESGSMDRIREAALSGVNETIGTIRDSQRENPDDNQMFTLVTFDSGVRRGPFVRTIIDNERIGNLPDLSPNQYRPGGMTPLYDAIGQSVTNLQKVVREGDSVLVTVVTDGLENSSREYTAWQISELVARLTAKGWVFTYIGANQSSEMEALRMGIKNTMDFKATEEGAKMMWDKMRSSHMAYYKKVRSVRKGENVDHENDFFAEKQSQGRVTPEYVGDLEDGKIFVFGSNPEGRHDGGVARLALERFGAINGKAEGLQGRSYAIPVDGLALGEIENKVREFIRFAERHPEMTFLVTRIGCGHSGWSEAQIAPLFAFAVNLPNVFLPASFWKVLIYRYR